MRRWFRYVVGRSRARRRPKLAGRGAASSQRPIDERWWLNSARRLDALVDEALQASPTLEAAQATLRQARETLDARAGATQAPQAGARLGAQRQRSNGAALGQPGIERSFELYNASVSVSYDLDLAGANRRALEALAAQVDHQHYQLEAARLRRGQRRQRRSRRRNWPRRSRRARRSPRSTNRSRSRQRSRWRRGARRALALRTQSSSRAAIPALRTRPDQAGHLLAVLAGRAPGEATAPRFAGRLRVAARPLRLPSELARSRPDMCLGAALLHAASAQRGSRLRSSIRSSR